MNEFDRELIELITDVDGEVWVLRELVELRGTALVARVIGDGFAEVFQATDDELFGPRSLEAKLDPPWRYLTTEEALGAIRGDRMPADYRVAQARGAVDLQAEPTLVFSYAADDRAAVAEVRRRNEEGRERWLQDRRTLLRRMRKRA